MADKLLETIVSRIVKEFDPERIYLFGSRASGESDEQSDYDLLVVADMPDIPVKKRAYQVRRLFPDRDFALDVIVKTPDDFRRCKTILNHICRIVDREGKLAYERRQ